MNTVYQYSTKFNLVYPVCNYEAAKAYLVEDDMATYLRDDLKDYCKLPHLDKENIISLEWVLDDAMSGHIILKTNVPLAQWELDRISSWVSGQNSDGLGEGFEQQDFASYDYNEPCRHGRSYSYYEDEYNDEYEEEWVMASFDWQTNEYTFSFDGIINRI